jgi:hypothetical protein
LDCIRLQARTRGSTRRADRDGPDGSCGSTEIEATLGHPALPDRARDAASGRCSGRVGAQHPFEMSNPAYQDPVQTSVPDRPHPTLGEGVGPRRSDRRADHPDAVAPPRPRWGIRTVHRARHLVHEHHQAIPDTWFISGWRRNHIVGWSARGVGPVNNCPVGDTLPRCRDVS